MRGELGVARRAGERGRPIRHDFDFAVRELWLEIAQTPGGARRRAARQRAAAKTPQIDLTTARRAFFPAAAQIPIYGTNKMLRATRAACTREVARVALYEPRCGTASASFHARICVPVVTEVRSSIRFLMRLSLIHI